MLQGITVVCVVVALILFALASPRGVFLLYLAVLTCVPIWTTSTTVMISVPLVTFVSLLAVPVLVTRGFRVTRADAVVAGFVLLVFMAVWLRGTPELAVAQVLLLWLPAYFFARSMIPVVGAEWAFGAIAVLFTILGSWSVLEFVTGIHLFENFVGAGDPNGWHLIQVRGAFSRSEGALGHSIVLGGYLSAGLAFILMRFRGPILGVAVVVNLLGTLATFSRGALISSVIVLLAFVLGRRSERRRASVWRIRVAALLSAVVVAPVIYTLFDSFGSEAASSSAYRASALAHIPQDAEVLGLARGVELGVNGQILYRGFVSIDNTYLLSTVLMGWAPVVLLVGALIYVLVRKWRSLSAPGLAMVGQLFLMSTVALITQYGMLVWLLAGILVTPNLSPLSRSAVVRLPAGERVGLSE